MSAAIEQFEVESESGRSYVVSRVFVPGITGQPVKESWQCGCKGWTMHTPRRDCKHIQYVKRFHLEGHPHGHMKVVTVDPLLMALAKNERKEQKRLERLKVAA